MTKNIIIYKAPIYRVFAEDVNLVKGNAVPTIKSEIVNTDEEFYNIYKSFVSLKYGCILAERDEACDFIYYSISKNNDRIVDLANNLRMRIHDKKQFHEYLKAISACLYFDTREMEEKKYLNNRQFRELKKRYNAERKKK